MSHGHVCVHASVQRAEWISSYWLHVFFSALFSLGFCGDITANSIMLRLECEKRGWSCSVE